MLVRINSGGGVGPAAEAEAAHQRDVLDGGPALGEAGRGLDEVAAAVDHGLADLTIGEVLPHRHQGGITGTRREEQLIREAQNDAVALGEARCLGVVTLERRDVVVGDATGATDWHVLLPLVCEVNAIRNRKRRNDHDRDCRPG